MLCDQLCVALGGRMAE